ncbi:hypothetical protein [Neptunomonas sp.]|uniref:hypothetical protein n=1 Tax=Neptunomonas sp. TaxID=1971898 RepID=UPI0025F18BDC|nr:hypothetical protein [Neptunomonas sp.]
MDTLFSIANLIAVFSAIGAALLGLTTYRRQKEIDIELKKGELKRTAVTDYLSSIESLINHAVYSNDQSSSNEAAEILKCKKDLNKIYIYAPTRVVAAMDKLLSEAIVLATIISKIPNAEIFEEDQVLRYSEKSNQVNEAYTNAVNIARKEIGLHTEKVGEVQLLLLGKF